MMKKVEVQLSMGERYTIEGRIHNHTVFVDQPAAAGGQDKGPTPLEYLLLAHGACVATIARIIASQKRIPLRGMKLGVSGEVDLDVLLGKKTDSRAGFTGITLKVEMDADIPREEKEKLLHEADRRCPVSDNLKQLTAVSVELA
jgi:putative redox protein